MLKAIVLTREERSEINRTYEKDGIYAYVCAIADEVSLKCQSFYLPKEVMFYEVMDVVDSIREDEGSDEAVKHILYAYSKCFGRYREYAEDPKNSLGDIRFNTAAVICTAASLLTLSAAPYTTEYVPALVGTLQNKEDNLPQLIKMTQRIMKHALTPEAIQAWKSYYLSEEYMSDDMKAMIQRLRKFDYIDMDKLEELSYLYSYQTFMKLFRDAVRGEAKVLVPFLVKFKGLKVLNFHNDDLKTIFNNLRDRFPEMKKYGYANFEKYAKPAQLIPSKQR